MFWSRRIRPSGVFINTISAASRAGAKFFSAITTYSSSADEKHVLSVAILGNPFILITFAGGEGKRSDVLYTISINFMVRGIA
ncbi:MAG: hypothetical protein R3A12_01860 [Ignavibacteria bacterium]